MAGTRQRCAYCSDSYASDIDHYVPIARDHGRVFSWKNFLWVCTKCNRQKGANFPVADTGEPLLVDPSRTDPWAHLTLDTATGFISPRYLESTFDPVGEFTLSVLPTINHEGVAEGRARVCRSLKKAIGSAATAPSSNQAREDLLTLVREDDVAVSRWYGYWEGSQEPEMVALRVASPKLWRRLLRACSY
ncbi:HNH endonuclease [Prauserella sp. ASG 168]|uniref:HNH endonuclease n=2 Tax=Prauserella cavernicola TaxID=2800127 RepID=A0A934QS63_9PSEU|nr:HNH endonuclease [Prauserella cavernicola]